MYGVSDEVVGVGRRMDGAKGSTQWAEAGGLRVQAQLGLYSETLPQALNSQRAFFSQPYKR